MKVPFLDLRLPHQELRAELDKAYERVVESGWFILGEELEAFERRFADFCGTRHCVGVGNGLDALHLSLLAHGIGAGDEVIVPANTYIATWLAISYAGATPIPVEPDTRTFNIDPQRIESAVTSRTRAVMPVHLYGRMADMRAIAPVCERHGLAIVEDCAQSHGARQHSRSAGSFGTAAWSFYPGKNLGALGDAGAVTTDDDAIAARIRMLRNYGSRKKYYNEVRGFNSRLDPLQAAFLAAKLDTLDEWNERRARVARRYASELAAVPDLELPEHGGSGENVWHLYVVRHPERDRLQKWLSGRGVGTLIHYPVPPHLSNAYSDAGWKRGAFPIAESLAETVLSIPVGPHLGDDEADYVIESIKSFER